MAARGNMQGSILVFLISGTPYFAAVSGLEKAG
jgi:hypothetical protein